MKTVELALKPITGYLISIKRNTVNGWYEFEIGIHANWVVGENDKIACEILNENESGKLLKISPKKDTIGIDDLILFVEAIINTNKKIAEKEKQFTDKMEQMKGVLEKEARKFYDDLAILKDTSFKNLTKSLELEKMPDKKEPRKPRKKLETNPPISGTTS
jgi:hypothetical protein